MILPVVRTILVAVCLALLAACSFQSDTLLTDARAAGDPIAGLPLEGSFGLESFDRQRNAYRPLGTMTAEKAEGGSVRYLFSLQEDSDRLAVRARQLLPGTYLLRYEEIGYPEPNASQTALVILSVENSNYYLLTSLADRKLYETVFPAAESRPATDGESIRLDNEAQARALAAFLRDHRDALRPDQDYLRLRLAK